MHSSIARMNERKKVQMYLFSLQPIAPSLPKGHCEAAYMSCEDGSHRWLTTEVSGKDKVCSVEMEELCDSCKSLMQRVIFKGLYFCQMCVNFILERDTTPNSNFPF